MPAQQRVIKWRTWSVSLAMAIALGGACWYGVLRAKPVHASSTIEQEDESAPTPAGVAVEVMAPLPGGIDRYCLQPGSLEPIEAADLYTKVSGYLVEQKVDLGDRVKAGDVLARIAVPEYEKQVKQEMAEVERAEARVEQMTAAIQTAEADLGAATAAIALAQAEKQSKVSYRGYREKQRERIRELVARKAVDAKLMDENEDQYQAAIAAELAAEQNVGAARHKELAARARIMQAQADLRFAKAEVATARARLEKNQVLLDYTTIRSPYTGVITKRNFHPGDFIRSADSGGERIPILAVERTDIMRVIIQVPERDVPFVNRGDPAVVELDALPGVVLKTRGKDKVEVTCLAASEDPHSRMMRTEVHVKNPEGKLCRGMFGRVTLCLHQGATQAFRIPSAALTGKADGQKGLVRVVRNDKVTLVPVRYNTDNGSQVEVVSGLTAADQVVVRASGPLSDGTPVSVVPGTASKGGH